MSPVASADATGDAPPAVRARGLGKTFAARAGTVRALEGIDLEIGRGEFVSLIGPSGCGKSTLLRIVADLEQPTTGEITVFGKTATRARLDQDYGIAFQQSGLLEWRTVAANIELPLELHGVPASARRARSAELLDLVGLRDVARAHPDQLSGGMQQRVAIARALAEEPGLLLLDEPFGALDEMTRERMQSELVRLSRASGAAVVLVTHSIPEAAFCSDRVVVMSPRPGRVASVVDVRLATERTEALREDPAFFAVVTAIREALHAGSGSVPGAAGPPLERA